LVQFFLQKPKVFYPSHMSIVRPFSGEIQQNSRGSCGPDEGWEGSARKVKMIKILFFFKYLLLPIIMEQASCQFLLFSADLRSKREKVLEKLAEYQRRNEMWSEKTRKWNLPFSRWIWS
jgi:hypothetical protein